MSGSDRVLDRLTALHPKVIDLSLDRIERLLAALGHPERRLPPVIHVAGTNGKGSVTAMAHAALVTGRIPAARYISPHLVDLRWTIRRVPIASRPTRARVPDSNHMVAGARRGGALSCRE